MKIFHQFNNALLWESPCSTMREVIGAEVGQSDYNPDTLYQAGRRIHPDSFDLDFKNECAPGIHFFITKEEAIAYNL